MKINVHSGSLVDFSVLLRTCVSFFPLSWLKHHHKNIHFNTDDFVELLLVKELQACGAKGDASVTKQTKVIWSYWGSETWRRLKEHLLMCRPHLSLENYFAAFGEMPNENFKHKVLERSYLLSQYLLCAPNLRQGLHLSPELQTKAKTDARVLI